MSEELVPVEDRYPVLTGDSGEFAEILAANFGDQGLNPTDLEMLRVPSGGGTTWEIATLAGTDSVRELEAIIVIWLSPRSYWESRPSDDGETVPPDCFSERGDYGQGEFGPGSEGNPEGKCEDCPMNVWGSAADDENPKARGKACRESRLLYLLRPGEMLPMGLRLPPTSMQAFRAYTTRLASAGKKYCAVITKFSLKPQSRGAYRWSTVEFAFGGELTPGQIEAVENMAKAVRG